MFASFAVGIRVTTAASLADLLAALLAAFLRAVPVVLLLGALLRLTIFFRAGIRLLPRLSSLGIRRNRFVHFLHVRNSRAISLHLHLPEIVSAHRSVESVVQHRGA